MTDNPCAKCSRRLFLKCGAAAGLLLAGCGGKGGSGITAPPEPPTPVPDESAPPDNRVVAVHAEAATTWDRTGDWYGSDSVVSQASLDQMVSQGVMALTNQTSESAAWARILPGYSSGKKISIKMNENNAGFGTGVIDPLPQLLKSLVRALKAGGVSEADIWFIEPSRTIDDRLAAPVKAAYPGVSFYGASATAYSSACTYASQNSSLTVSHGAPGINPSHLPDQLGVTTWLIHMPIMKAHSLPGVTLTYKNLFGLLQAPTIKQLHGQVFNTSNSPFVELYGNANVGGKTALILADGIYGNWEDNTTAPKPWKVFGGDLWPKRIFLSVDPVAVDSVMFDFLQWERQDLTVQAEAPLIAGAAANQGTRDHWNNPQEKKYGKIDFIQRETS